MNRSQKLIRDYEIDANKNLAMISRIMVLLLIAVGVLNYLKVFRISGDIYPALGIAVAVMTLPILFYDVLHLNSRFIRYFVLTAMVLMAGMLYCVVSYHVILMLAFPIVIATVYCDRASVIYTSVISVPVLVVAHLVAFQLKIVPDEPLVTLRGVLVYGVLPRFLELMSFAVICTAMSDKVHKLVLNLAKTNDELYREQEVVVNSLSEMMEGQSQETGQHVKRVGEYTRVLCEALGMDEVECRLVSMAARMHDVGKIMVPQEIIDKPGRLTPEEFEVVKTHTDYGRQLLINAPGELMQVSATIAYQHHERYDGKGYHGIKGEDIDLYARCVAIADVFDALVSRRPYKEPWPPQAARDEILRCAGTQFDPELTELFRANYPRFEEILARNPDAAPAVQTGQE